MNLVIKPLTVEDAAEVIAVVSQIAGLDTVVLTREEFNMDVEAERKFLARYVNVVDGLAFGAWLEEKLRGVLFLDRCHRQRRRHVLTLGICVEPRFWGRGIGRNLVDHAVMRAFAIDGIRRIELSVGANNPRALALFHSTGFVEEGRKRLAILLPTEAIDEVLMARLSTHD